MYLAFYQQMLIILILFPLCKPHPLDEAARPLGEGIAFSERFPVLFAVVAVQAVDHLVGDNVVDHPLGPAFDLIADADMAISGAAVGAAAQLSVHIAYPADGIPFDLSLEIFLVEIYSALLELGVGAALG